MHQSSMAAVGLLVLSFTSAGRAESPMAALEDVDLRSTGVQFAFAPEALLGEQESKASAPAAAEPAEPVSAGGAAEPFGTKGSWRVNVYGGAAFGVKRGGELGMLGVGFSYFIAKDFSLEMELHGVYASQSGDDALGGNVNLLLRWHFCSTESWSLYADAGAGLMLTTDDVPQQGSSFNFTPQAGGGVSVQVFDDARLLAGIRWHHVSNANLYDENPGRDNVLFYAGLSFPY